MKPHIVGIGGTTRAGSSSERLVRAVLSETEKLGSRVTMFGGLELAALPHFAPENPERTADQQTFVDTVRSADGLVIGTPGYHGGVSGLVKNAIDLLEDTNRDARVYFDGLPVGLIVSAAGWQAGGVTLAALRGIVHAMRGWPTPVGICVNTVAQKLFDGEAVSDESVRASIVAQASQVMRLAQITDRTTI
ncbi:NADPH-dependent FMN reductase [Sphingobium sp.]|uniref:NADPH-dependent FMN reductase n=1 Tax=Sphingobium sp. TaxID=1912891 RepID=UPI0028BD93F7|nr:NADPH-dependent FMN reductase [Sphingobium sp.]